MPPKSARGGKKEDPPPPMGPGSRLVSLPKFMKKFVFFNGVRLDPEQKKIEGKKLVFNFTTACFKVGRQGSSVVKFNRTSVVLQITSDVS